MEEKKKQETTDVEDIQQVEMSESVDPDKFDRHMRKARHDDIRARRKAFIHLGQAEAERAEKKANIKSSVY